jgi:hypothetical protein
VILTDCPVPVYGNQEWRGKCPSESVEQITFFNRIRKIPIYGLIAVHPRNEGVRHYKQVSKEKAEGMTKGASDIIIPGNPSFVCELKRRDRTQSSWQDGQKEYLEAAKRAGAFTCVALGADAAMEALEEWLSLQARG